MLASVLYQILDFELVITSQEFVITICVHELEHFQVDLVQKLQQFRIKYS